MRKTIRNSDAASAAVISFFAAILFLMVAGATHVYAHGDNHDNDSACIACQISAGAVIKIAPDGQPVIAPELPPEVPSANLSNVVSTYLPLEIRSRDPPVPSRSV